MHFPPHGLKKRQLSVPFRVLHIWPNFFPWLKHSVLWTIFKGVLIIRVDRTNFDVVTRQIEKVHRGRCFPRGDREFGLTASFDFFFKITG